MQRIGSSDGLFHDGDSSTNTKGTLLAAAWFNAIQEEIVSVLTAAGLTLNSASYSQLLQAILLLIESKSGNYSLDTGSTNAYVIALTPAITAYSQGEQIRFRATNANTGPCTVNAGGGAVSLLRDDGSALVAGDIPQNSVVSATYDQATNAFMMNSVVASQIDTIMQSGAPLFALDTGAANAYVAAYVPAITKRTEGMVLRFKAKTANTGASTFNDGLGSAPLLGASHAALQGGEIVVNGDAWVQWNSSIGAAGSYILLECTGAPLQIPAGTASGHAVNLGQLTSGAIALQSATPSQFDRSTLTANTSWVRQLGNSNCNVVAQNSGTITLSVTDSGKLHNLGSVAGTVTLPSANSSSSSYVGSGGAIEFICSVAGMTIAPPSGEYLWNGTSGVTSVAMGVGDTLRLVSIGNGYWHIAGGSVALRQTNIIGGTVRGARNNLVITYTGTSGAVTVSADELALENGSNSYVTLRNISISATSGSTTGAANGLDTGSWAYSTVYYLYVIYNGATTALLWSLSSTAPTLPSGYTYYARVGFNSTQSATNYWFLGGKQLDRRFQFVVNAPSNVTGYPRLSSGSQGSSTAPTYVAVSLASYIGSTTRASAVHARISLQTASTQAGLHPNANAGAYTSLTNPPLMMISTSTAGAFNAATDWINLESSSVYYFNNDSSYGSLHLLGWEDNL